MLLPITLTLAAASALIALWLAVRVGQARHAAKVSIGDGGDPTLVARMRAQANFVEYTPFVLVLVGLIELARGPQAWLWGVAILYVLARLAHPIGMDRPSPNALRSGAILVTFVLLLGLAGYGLTIVYAGAHS
ncbi:MAG: MAPEG family protein [Sphingomonadaceae bacterium]|nr:MAPEG family protein [Sphingomonadaceae bacterium]